VTKKELKAYDNWRKSLSPPRDSYYAAVQPEVHICEE
jgi:hypothetical protein